MSNSNALTPGVLVGAIRENQNKNKTLKAIFATHFLGKFTNEELEGLEKSIQKEISKRQTAIVEEKITFLESLGFKVSK